MHNFSFFTNITFDTKILTIRIYSMIEFSYQIKRMIYLKNCDVIKIYHNNWHLFISGIVRSV